MANPVSIDKISFTFVVVVCLSACRYRECSLFVLRRSNGTQDPLPVQELPATHRRLSSSTGHHVPAQIQVWVRFRLNGNLLHFHETA